MNLTCARPCARAALDRSSPARTRPPRRKPRAVRRRRARGLPSVRRGSGWARARRRAPFFVVWKYFESLPVLPTPVTAAKLGIFILSIARCGRPGLGQGER